MRCIQIQVVVDAKMFCGTKLIIEVEKGVSLSEVLRRLAIQYDCLADLRECKNDEEVRRLALIIMRGKILRLNDTFNDNAYIRLVPPISGG